MKLLERLRSAARAHIRAIRRAGLRAVIRAAFKHVISAAWKLAGIAILAMIAIYAVPILPPSLQTALIEQLRKTGVPGVLIPIGPEDVKYTVRVDSEVRAALVNDLFVFGAASKDSPVTYDASEIPNVVVCHPWAYAAGSMNAILLEFLRAHSGCFAVSKRDPAGYVISVNPKSARSVRRSDGTVRAVSCECANAADVGKLLDSAELR